MQSLAACSNIWEAAGHCLCTAEEKGKWAISGCDWVLAVNSSKDHVMICPNLRAFRALRCACTLCFDQMTYPQIPVLACGNQGLKASQLGAGIRI